MLMFCEYNIIDLMFLLKLEYSVFAAANGPDEIRDLHFFSYLKLHSTLYGTKHHYNDEESHQDLLIIYFPVNVQLNNLSILVDM